MLKQNNALDKRAINLSANSGLKGSPELGLDKTLTARAVLMPEIVPGQMLKIESAVFNGAVVVQSLRFEGINFGEAWEASLEYKIAKS